ncbi:MAG TPA: hypothetical protein VJ793_08440 [Anaerolineae bacterium]|nr:hypothetical protein [Anaerolineae bacterium]
MPSADEVLQALSRVQEPELHRDLVSLNMEQQAEGLITDIPLLN